MIYSYMTVKAMKIAYAAHQGQVDKGGVPYIFYPIHLAEKMRDEVSFCVALLHDVVEDTEVTMEDLAREFPSTVTAPLKLLTHRDGVDYFDYVRAIKGDPCARAVKLADLRHNMDASRLCAAGPSAGTERLLQKYREAYSILTDEVD